MEQNNDNGDIENFAIFLNDRGQFYKHITTFNEMNEVIKSAEDYTRMRILEFTATKEARILDLESQIKLLEVQLKSSKQDVEELNLNKPNI